MTKAARLKVLQVLTKQVKIHDNGGSLSGMEIWEASLVLRVFELNGLDIVERKTKAEKLPRLIRLDWDQWGADIKALAAAGRINLKKKKPCPPIKNTRYAK